MVYIIKIPNIKIESAVQKLRRRFSVPQKKCHKPLSSCIPRSLQGAAPTITGWLSTIMLQSGDTARLPCHIEGDTGSHSVVWRDAQGSLVTADGRYRLEGTDLVISQASWADMGRFTCTAQNGFGVDLASTFLYPLAPAFY